MLPLASSCGLAVAVLYLSQPILPLIGLSFHEHASAVGLAVTATQAGYAVGLLTLAPLADCVERKRLIVLIVLANVVSAISCAFAHSFPIFLISSFALGLTAVTAQIIIPTVSGSVPASLRGKSIGILMSGMSAGPLLARVVSGFLAAESGWRAVFVVAAVLDLTLLTIVIRALPSAKPPGDKSWLELMRSFPALVRSNDVLQEASLCGAAMFAIFSAVWASLASLLAKPPYEFATSATGLVGLVGIVSIASAPLMGGLIDRRIGRRMSIFATMTALSTSVALGLIGRNLCGLLLCLALLDLANRAALIGGVTRIQVATSDARARANTVFMTSWFGGGAVGAATGSLASSYAGWWGLGASCAFFASIALLVGQVFTKRRKRLHPNKWLEHLPSPGPILTEK